MWTYSNEARGEDAGKSLDLTGFEVHASDGSIGTVDAATYDVDASYIVVDTGPWIFGKKVMLPAGVVHRIDLGRETLFVDRTKEQIKQAPEYGEDTDDAGYRDALGSYYAETGDTWRDSPAG